MKTQTKRIQTPLEILEAIRDLTEQEKETLAILADKELSDELLKRRKDVMLEMQRGELIREEDLFRDS
ncbi:MAG: hypothetical protein K9N21_12015 [Deltaproteobacteria bacterium]|nr:hypothetical protein [Deltaproteobacteria bacterium]